MMAGRCLLYYITDRSQLPGDENARRRALLEKIGEAAHAGVDYIQLREKDLGARALEALAREAVRIVREEERRASQPNTTRLLINSRTDIALAVGADGVHLRADDVSAATVRLIWNNEGGGHSSQPKLQSSSQLTDHRPLIAVSCHTSSDVLRAQSEGADFAVFAPVFEKRGAAGIKPKGAATLRQACAAEIPVLALGGVTQKNAACCLAAGAAGIAGIRLFQENKIEEVVRALRAL